VATTLAYQFFENRWVHPFIGVGVEGVRESERLDVELLPPRGIAPPPAPETSVTYVARPFIAGGAKFYVSERGFIRTDVLSTFSSDGEWASAWTSDSGRQSSCAP
jgi:hypothetical protein